MIRAPRSPQPYASAGFTLIEIIAVVAIIAMVFAVGIPRLGGSNYDPLKNEAERIAESLRFARQRAIMTGVPHRVLIDLEEGGYLIEWFVSEDRALSAVGEGAAEDGSGFGDFGAALGAGSDGPIDLRPPRLRERDYFPIPSAQMGRMRWLDDALYFVGVEGASGWVEGGDYPIVFFVDGTTEAALLEMADADDNHMTLTIEPILDRVRLRTGGARS